MNTHVKSAVADPVAFSGDPHVLPVIERGPWIATASGKMWSIEHPHPADVLLDDLAWGAARQCRYGGQIRTDLEIYAVTEHQTKMTWWAIREGRAETLEQGLAILLHDASEGIYGDMVTPLKLLLPEFRVKEDQAQAVITTAFGLSPENTAMSKAELKEIDIRIRIDERLQVIQDPARQIGLSASLGASDDGLKPLGVRIAAELPSVSRRHYLECFCWCVENLAAVDPRVEQLARAQIAGIPGSIAARRPEDSEIFLTRAELALLTDAVRLPLAADAEREVAEPAAV